MLFKCPYCGKRYTITQVDQMEKKNIVCACGVKTKDFKLLAQDWSRLPAPSF